MFIGVYDQLSDSSIGPMSEQAAAELIHMAPELLSKLTYEGPVVPGNWMRFEDWVLAGHRIKLMQYSTTHLSATLLVGHVPSVKLDELETILTETLEEGDLTPLLRAGILLNVGLFLKKERPETPNLAQYVKRYEEQVLELCKEEAERLGKALEPILGEAGQAPLPDAPA